MIFKGPIEKYEINDTRLHLYSHLEFIEEKNLSTFDDINNTIIDSSQFHSFIFILD